MDSQLKGQLAGGGLGAAAAGGSSGMRAVGRDELLDKRGVAKAGGYKRSQRLLLGLTAFVEAVEWRKEG